jgi:hypothetical protein
VKGEIVIENNMKIFKTAQINAWEFAPIKISLLCVGIAIGANWPELFAGYVFPIFLFGLALGIYAAIVWLKK